MPELPEVEIVARGLAPVLRNRTIVNVDLRRKTLRYPLPRDFARRLEGRAVTHVGRRAKYILATLENGDTLLIHLGMTGRLTIIPVKGPPCSLGELYAEGAARADAKGKHDHIVITLDDGTCIVFTDPRRFGAMDIVRSGETSKHKLLKGLGLEPLGNEFNTAYLVRKFKRKAAPLKAALLDQRIVAGLGNIYVCEALFRARLSPRRKAGTLVKAKSHDPRLDELVRHIREILNEAIVAGGSTLQDFAATDGVQGSFQERFRVYDREDKPCPACRAPVKRLVQSGRSTFYCAHCQK